VTLENKRLFFGLAAPLDQSQEFLNMAKKLKINADHKTYDVQWPNSKYHHITLRFLGPTPVELIPQLNTITQEVAALTTEFSLEARNVGGFPDLLAARVIYVGCQKSTHLASLYLGLNTETHDLNPHVTIGRIRHKRSISDLISPFVRKSFGKIKFDRLTLFESVPRGKYSVYLPIFEAPFSKRQE
jgi:RNA 2',3'-cyclic 3'-phosphodiesterase